MKSTYWRLATVAALASFGLVGHASPAQAQDPVVDLRVLTPNGAIEQGRSYVVPRGTIQLPTTPRARCFGAPGGSGQSHSVRTQTALGALGVASRANQRLRPLRLTDQFGFGLGICAIGGVDGDANRFWNVRVNHTESDLGAGEARVRNGDEVLYYLTPDTFPDPGPAALLLQAPARSDSTRVRVRVRAVVCAFDQATGSTRCGARPARNARVRGGRSTVRANANGVATVPARRGMMRLRAVRGRDIPTAVKSVCVHPRAGAVCPSARGRTIIGTDGNDRIRGTRGDDVIRSRAGNDVIDVRAGGSNRIHCGGGRRNTVIANQGQRLQLRNCQRVVRR